MSATTYQGAPCKRGHSGVRRLSTGNCIECEKERVRPKEPVRRRRELELVAIVSHAEGPMHVQVAVTLSGAGDGFRRETFDCDETPAGLIAAIREVADWLEREYVEIAAKEVAA